METLDHQHHLLRLLHLYLQNQAVRFMKLVITVIKIRVKFKDIEIDFLFSIFLKFLETREPGYCETSDGSRQNSGKIQKFGPNNELLADINTAYLENLCLKECREQPGATGCEIVWGRDTRGCYAHTNEVSRGSGAQKGYQHMCWIFNTIGSSEFGLGEFLNQQ